MVQNTQADCYYRHAGHAGGAGLSGPALTGDWSAVKMPLPDLGPAPFGQPQRLSTEPSQWQSRDWLGASPDRIIASGKALTEEVRLEPPRCGACPAFRQAAPCAAVSADFEPGAPRRTSARSTEAFLAPAKPRRRTAASSSPTSSPPTTRLPMPCLGRCRMVSRGCRVISLTAHSPRHNSATTAPP